MAELKINYTDISKACDNLQSLANNFESTIEELNSIIEKIKNPAWSGIASESFVQKVQNFCSNLETGKETLALSVLYLAGCADGYQSIDKNSYDKLIELLGGQTKIDGIEARTLPEINVNERIISQYVDENMQTDTITPILTTEGNFVDSAQASTGAEVHTYKESRFNKKSNSLVHGN